MSDKNFTFRPSELVINESNGNYYLNIRNAGNDALIDEAREKGVKDYEPKNDEEEDEEEEEE